MRPGAFETTAVRSEGSAHFLQEAVGGCNTAVCATTSMLPINQPETCDHSTITSNVTRNQRTLINDATCLLLKVT